MQLFRRWAIVVPLADDQFLVHALPLRDAQATCTIGEFTDLKMTDESGERTFVLNTRKYYIISPGSFERIEVPPPPEPLRLDSHGDPNIPRYTFDLMPCPQTMLPFPGLQVCIDSRYRDAVLLHPDRLFPTAQEAATTVEDFGTIEMLAAAAPGYRWTGSIVREEGGFSRFLDRKKYGKRIKDSSGEFSVGTYKPPQPQEKPASARR